MKTRPNLIVAIVFAVAAAVTVGAQSDDSDDSGLLEAMDRLRLQVMNPQSEEAQRFERLFYSSLDIYQHHILEGGDNSPETFFEIVESTFSEIFGNDASSIERLALKAWRVLGTISERLGPVYDHVCADLPLMECLATPHHHHDHGDDTGAMAPHWEMHGDINGEGHNHRHRHTP